MEISQFEGGCHFALPDATEQNLETTLSFWIHCLCNKDLFYLQWLKFGARKTCKKNDRSWRSTTTFKDVVFPKSYWNALLPGTLGPKCQIIFPGTLPRLSQEIYAHPVQKRNIHFQNWPFIGTIWTNMDPWVTNCFVNKRHLMADDVKIRFRGTIIYVQALFLGWFPCRNPLPFPCYTTVCSTMLYWKSQTSRHFEVGDRWFRLEMIFSLAHISHSFGWIRTLPSNWVTLIWGGGFSLLNGY